MNISIPHILEATEAWVKEFVIQENLCPFAAFPESKGQNYYTYTDVKQDENAFLEAFWQVLSQMIDSKGDNYISNTLMVVHPENTFDDIMIFSSVACEFILGAELESLFQIVEFHPELHFDEEEEKSEAGQYVNRSPYPFIHILRTNEVEMAVHSHPNVDAIPNENEEKLKSIGAAKLAEMLQSFQNKTY